LAVDFLLGLFAAGWPPDQILESYPTLTPGRLLTDCGIADDEEWLSLRWSRDRKDLSALARSDRGGAGVKLVDFDIAGTLTPTDEADSVCYLCAFKEEGAERLTEDFRDWETFVRCLTA
jgi:hypothetical protein